MYFWGWVCCPAVQAHSREGGWYTGVSRFSLIYPNSRILIVNHLASKASKKNLAKRPFANSFQWKKCTQLLLTDRIWHFHGLTK